HCAVGVVGDQSQARVLLPQHIARVVDLDDHGRPNFPFAQVLQRAALIGVVARQKGALVGRDREQLFADGHCRRAVVEVHHPDGDIADVAAEGVAQSHKLDQGQQQCGDEQRRAATKFAQIALNDREGPGKLNGRLFPRPAAAGAPADAPSTRACPVKCRKTSSSEVLWTAKLRSSTPCCRLRSIMASAVAGPRSLEMRYRAVPCSLTFFTMGKASRSAAPFLRSGANCASMRLAPGTAALSAAGVSRATILPWSTMAMRSQSLSASSM